MGWPLDSRAQGVPLTDKPERRGRELRACLSHFSIEPGNGSKNALGSFGHSSHFRRKLTQSRHYIMRSRCESSLLGPSRKHRSLNSPLPRLAMFPKRGYNKRDLHFCNIGIIVLLAWESNIVISKWKLQRLESQPIILKIRHVSLSDFSVFSRIHDKYLSCLVLQIIGIVPRYTINE